MKRFVVARIFLVACLSPGMGRSQSAAPSQIPTDYLNGSLPGWLKFGGEERLRFEGFSGGNFQSGNNDAYLLSRLRFNMGLLPESWLKFGFQVQDSRVGFKNLKPYAPPYQDTFDLRIAYIEFGDSEKMPVSLRIGRQEINLGEERLVGSSNWTNTARTFDAARLHLRKGKLRLDAFASSPVSLQDGNVGDHIPGNNLHGLYGGMDSVVPAATIEPYFFWRLQQRLKTEAGNTGNLDEKTLGIRWVGKLPFSFDYGTEMAVQRGSLGTDDVLGFAGHWIVGNKLPLPLNPRCYLEYNYASGDGNSKDGVRRTFDQLFPSGHDKLDLADQVGWKNILHVRSGFELKPGLKWMVSARYSGYWLADPHDALYNSSGTAIVRSVNGSAGRFVGTEFDTNFIYNYSKQFQVGAGFGHLFPGTFLEHSTPGKAYTYPYLMLNTIL
ncbi:MAG TPA: alginate export family protein [Bryobacteraceae bacterium]|jgi:hypothetical protein